MQAYLVKNALKSLGRGRRLILISACSAAAAILYGCATPAGSSSTARSSPGAASADSHPTQPPLGYVQPGGPGVEVVATHVDARPAALVNGRMVDWGDLRPILSEAAGGDALSEFILDGKLAEAVKNAGLVVDADAIAWERSLMLQNLNEDPNQAARLLQELQERQRLGPTRFQMLLRRNASLRALVRDHVQITDEAVQQINDVLHGTRRQARLIVVKTLSDAETVLENLKTGQMFSDLAVSSSIDSSASRGGLLEPISRSDPAYPAAMRESLFSLTDGEVSRPVLLEDRFAILQLVREIPGDKTSVDENRSELERLVRLNQERLMMEQLARRLLLDSSVVIYDESLESGWRFWRKSAPTP